MLFSDFLKIHRIKFIILQLYHILSINEIFDGGHEFHQ